MLNEYNSDARQNQVLRTLEMLRLKTIMEEKGLNDLMSGMTALVERIQEMTPQCHKDFRTDRHMVKNLQHAVAEYEFAAIPIQSIDSAQLDFRKFVTALFSALQTSELIKQVASERGPNIGGNQHSVHIADQYSRNPRHLRRTQNRKSVAKVNKKRGPSV